MHVLGAARSGTTLIHCAMAAFDSTIVHPRESNIHHPRIGVVARIGLQNRIRGVEQVYVTKRGYGWFDEGVVNEFVEDALACNYCVIYMVRDPADVLTSRHRGESSRQFYLEPSRWLESIRSGELLTEKLANQVPFLTIRYEDLVTHPETIRAQIESTMGLQLRPEVQSWSDLSNNVDASSLGDLATALHSIRSFDATSVGKWRKDEDLKRYWNQLLSGEYGSELIEFGKRYGYESVMLELER